MSYLPGCDVRALMCGVEEDACSARHLWSPPHHCDGTNRGQGKDKRTTFSRTHVLSHDIVCVIFGAQPSYRQITSSSVSLA